MGQVNNRNIKLTFTTGGTANLKDVAKEFQQIDGSVSRLNANTKELSGKMREIDKRALGGLTTELARVSRAMGLAKKESEQMARSLTGLARMQASGKVYTAATIDRAVQSRLQSLAQMNIRGVLGERSYQKKVEQTLKTGDDMRAQADRVRIGRGVHTFWMNIAKGIETAGELSGKFFASTTRGAKRSLAKVDQQRVWENFAKAVSEHAGKFLVAPASMTRTVQRNLAKIDPQRERQWAAAEAKYARDERAREARVRREAAQATKAVEAKQSKVDQAANKLEQALVKLIENLTRRISMMGAMTARILTRARTGPSPDPEASGAGREAMWKFWDRFTRKTGITQEGKYTGLQADAQARAKEYAMALYEQAKARKRLNQMDLMKEYQAVTEGGHRLIHKDTPGQRIIKLETMMQGAGGLGGMAIFGGMIPAWVKMLRANQRGAYPDVTAEELRMKMMEMDQQRYFRLTQARRGSQLRSQARGILEEESLPATMLPRLTSYLKDMPSPTDMRAFIEALRREAREVNQAADAQHQFKLATQHASTAFYQKFLTRPDIKEFGSAGVARRAAAQLEMGGHSAFHGTTPPAGGGDAMGPFGPQGPDDIIRQAKAIQQTEKALFGATSKAKTFWEVLQKGGKGAASMFNNLDHTVGRFVKLFLLYRVADFFRGMLRSAIGIQSTIEQMRLGFAETLSIAARLTDTITGKELPALTQVQQSFVDANSAMAGILDASIKFGLPLQRVAEAFAITAGAARQGNIELKDSVEIITQLAVLAERLQIPPNVLARDVRDIFTGLNVQRTILGNLLGLNQSIVREWIRQGTLGEELVKKLELVKLTMEENLQTFSGIRLSITAIIQKIFLVAGKPVFAQMRAVLTDIRNALKSIADNEDAMKGIAESAFQFAQSIRSVATDLALILPTLLKFYVGYKVFRGASALATGAANLQQESIAAGTGSLVSSAIGTALLASGWQGWALRVGLAIGAAILTYLFGDQLVAGLKYILKGMAGDSLADTLRSSNALVRNVALNAATTEQLEDAYANINRQVGTYSEVLTVAASTQSNTTQKVYEQWVAETQLLATVKERLEMQKKLEAARTEVARTEAGQQFARGAEEVLGTTRALREYAKSQLPEGATERDIGRMANAIVSTQGWHGATGISVSNTGQVEVTRGWLQSADDVVRANASIVEATDKHSDVIYVSERSIDDFARRIRAGEVGLVEFITSSNEAAESIKKLEEQLSSATETYLGENITELGRVIAGVSDPALSWRLQVERYGNQIDLLFEKNKSLEEAITIATAAFMKASNNIEARTLALASLRTTSKLVGSREGRETAQAEIDLLLSESTAARVKAKQIKDPAARAAADRAAIEIGVKALQGSRFAGTGAQATVEQQKLREREDWVRRASEERDRILSQGYTPGPEGEPLSEAYVQQLYEANAAVEQGNLALADQDRLVSNLSAQSLEYQIRMTDLSSELSDAHADISNSIKDHLEYTKQELDYMREMMDIMAERRALDRERRAITGIDRELIKAKSAATEAESGGASISTQRERLRVVQALEQAQAERAISEALLKRGEIEEKLAKERAYLAQVNAEYEKRSQDTSTKGRELAERSLQTKRDATKEVEKTQNAIFQTINEEESARNRVLELTLEQAEAQRRLNDTTFKWGAAITEGLAEGLANFTLQGGKFFTILQTEISNSLSSAFKEAFKNTIKEKLKFDEVFKKNLLEYIPGVAKQGGDKAGSGLMNSMMSAISSTGGGTSGGGGGGGGGIMNMISGIFSGAGGGGAQTAAAGATGAPSAEALQGAGAGMNYGGYSMPGGGTGSYGQTLGSGTAGYGAGEGYGMTGAAGQSVAVPTGASGGALPGQTAAGGGGGGGVGAGGYAMAAYVVMSTAQGLQKGYQKMNEIKYKPGVTREKLMEAQYGQIPIPIVGPAIGGLTRLTGKLGGGRAAGAVGGMASGALMGAAIGSVIPVIGTAIGAIVGGVIGGVLGGVLQPKVPSTRKIIEKMMKSILKDLEIPTMRITAKKLDLRADLAGLKDLGKAAGSLLGIGINKNRIGRGGYQNEFVSNIVLNNAQALGIAMEDAEKQFYELSKTVLKAKDFTGAILKVRAAEKKGKKSSKQAIQGDITDEVAILIGAYNEDLPRALDYSMIAMNLFVENGIIDIKRLERTIEDMKTTVTGAGSFVTAMIKTGNLYDAGKAWGESLMDGLIKRIQERMLETSVIGQVITTVGVQVSKAAEYFAAGQVQLGNQALAVARNQAMKFEVDVLSKIAPFFASIQGFGSTFGVTPGPGLVNQSGYGTGVMQGGFMTSHGTPTLSVVPGPYTRPTPAVLHGGESVRSPEQEDKLYGLMSEIRDALTDGKSRPAVFQGGPTTFILRIDGKDVVARLTGVERKGGGMLMPNTKAGIQ